MGYQILMTLIWLKLKKEKLNISSASLYFNLVKICGPSSKKTYMSGQYSSKENMQTV